MGRVSLHYLWSKPVIHVKYRIRYTAKSINGHNTHHGSPHLEQNIQVKYCFIWGIKNIFPVLLISGLFGHKITY